MIALLLAAAPEPLNVFLGLFVAGATGWVLVWFDSDGEPWKRRRG